MPVKKISYLGKPDKRSKSPNKAKEATISKLVNVGQGNSQEVKVETRASFAKLKNLFIPHWGNNYQPEFLKTKRIFWYGISAVLMKSIVIAAVLLPMLGWATLDGSFDAVYANRLAQINESSMISSFDSQKISAIESYLGDDASNYAKLLFVISSIYFNILLIVVAAVLALYVFAMIKPPKLRVILPAVSLILLLIALILI